MAGDTAIIGIEEAAFEFPAVMVEATVPHDCVPQQIAKDFWLDLQSFLKTCLAVSHPVTLQLDMVVL